MAAAGKDRIAVGIEDFSATSIIRRRNDLGKYLFKESSLFGRDKNIEPILTGQLFPGPAGKFKQEIIAENYIPGGIKLNRDKIDIIQGIPVSADRVE